MKNSDQSPPIYSTLEEAVEAFASRAEERFDLLEATNAVAATLSDLPSDPETAVDEELCESVYLFEDMKRADFVPRRRFFQGRQFLIQPTAWEVGQQLLIPGHRFIPFCLQHIFPPQCRLRWGDGNELPVRTVRLPFDDLAVYFSLFGMHGLFEYLAADHSENDVLLNTPSEIAPQFHLTAFDLSAFFSEQGFTEGDALRCTVGNWQEGVFALERASAEELQAETILRNRWIQTLDELLLAVFDEFGPSLSPQEQLARAFFLGPDWMAESAPIHIGGYLAESRHVEIHVQGMESILWKQGEQPDLLAAAADMALGTRAPTGRCDSLNAILNEVGVALDEAEIEAYMRDALWNANTDLDTVVDRCLKGRGSIAFYDERQAEAFFHLLEKQWHELQASYDRSRDATSAPLRSRLLDVLDRQVALLRECDRRHLNLDDLPKEASMEHAQLTALVAQLLNVLNNQDVTEEQIVDLSGMADDLMTRFDDSSTRLAQAIRQDPATSPLQIMDSADAPGGAIFQLKITLKGIRPPIWRRIQVADHITLDELSSVIPAVMGWHGGHLHCFRFGSMEYGLPLEDDLFGPAFEDQTGVLLRNLIREEGDRFRYEYDFGDDWQHNIVLEKILPVEEDVDYPRCIKGRRACPPEDCGGVPGYLDLIEVQADPSHPDYADLNAWLGASFDPERFDLERINLRIQG